MVVGLLAAPVVTIGLAYTAFALLTRKAPPPPSFTRPVRAAYDTRLDGRWYSDACQALTIAGGWLIAANYPSTRTSQQARTLVAPVDLRRVQRGGPALTIELNLSGKPVAYLVRLSSSLALGPLGAPRLTRFHHRTVCASR